MTPQERVVETIDRETAAVIEAERQADRDDLFGLWSLGLSEVECATVLRERFGLNDAAIAEWLGRETLDNLSDRRPEHCPRCGGRRTYRLANGPGQGGWHCAACEAPSGLRELAGVAGDPRDGQ